MPDVTIVVEASLGDSLAKLDLAKHAVDDLGDSGESASQHLKDFNSSMDDATLASHKAGAAIHDTEALIRDAESAINDTESALTGGGNSGGRGSRGGGLIGALDSMGNAANQNVPLLFGLSVPIAALPVVAGAAVVAIIALADALGTLVAIAADFVAPLTLVSGLLGLLGLGFGLAAKRASEGGGKLSEFSKALDTLQSMFAKTTDILAHAFLPYLLKLADAGKQALLFIDKLASGSLTNAFRLLSTQGVQMLNSFIQAVANVLAHPIRIAFKIAFGQGKGGNEIASAVAGWWHQFTDYLFGYSNTHQIHIGRFLGRMTTTQVDGVLQPLIDWFNRHHFTKQGIQIGHEILNGLMSSGAAKRMGQFIVQVLVDAFKVVVAAAMREWGRLNTWFNAALQRWHDEINQWVEQGFIDAFHAVEHVAVSVLDSIKSHIGEIGTAVTILAGIFAGPLVSAVQQVVGAVNGILSGINSAIGAANTLVSALGGLTGPTNPSSNPGKGSGRGLGSHPGVRLGSRTVVAHFHFHGNTSGAAFSRQVREIGRELNRQQNVLAGGY